MKNDIANAKAISPGSTEPTRRSFLDYLIGSTAVATLGAIVYPIFRFISPPQIVESTENSVVAAKLSEVPVNSGKIFKFGNKPGILVHTAAGEFKALSAVCTHLGCTVPWIEKQDKFICPCHQAIFDPTGRLLGGPAPRGMDALPMKIEQGVVKVQYQFFRQLTPKKEVIA